MPYEPMQASSRAEQLKKLKKEAEPYSSKDIFYKGVNRLLKVHQIPLKYLVFNPYNNRIATFVKTEARLTDEINVETVEGSKKIEEFIERSSPDKNKKTKIDLLKKEQQEPGIVTADGVVVSGNRRFMLLKQIAEEKGNPDPYFKAVILDDPLDSNRREIMTLETTYQNGVDDRVDYSPIQKYLQCKEFNQLGASDKEIATTMGEDETEITKYLGIMKLLDEYLGYCGYPGIYTFLDNLQADERFRELYKWLEKYKNNTAPLPHFSWSPKEYDIDDLKFVCFDYIRTGGERINTIDARQIGHSTKDPKKKGFFSDENLWQEFSKSHFKITKAYSDTEKDLDSMRKEETGVEELYLIKKREEEFKNAVGGALEGNFLQTRRKVENQAEKNEPLKLLIDAKNCLETIDMRSDAFAEHGEKIQSISHDIRKLAEEFIKEAKVATRG